MVGTGVDPVTFRFSGVHKPATVVGCVGPSGDQPCLFVKPRSGLWVSVDPQLADSDEFTNFGYILVRGMVYLLTSLHNSVEGIWEDRF